MTKEELNAMNKPAVVEIAIEKGIIVKKQTKGELIDLILKGAPDNAIDDKSIKKPGNKINKLFKFKR